VLHYLWKPVENERMSFRRAHLAGEPATPIGAGAWPANHSAAGLSACSACAGEYEDPDATSRTEVSDQGQEQELEQELELEEFPVRGS
jgi:hypothetical protein